jgi:hypothetical protein
LPPKMDGPKVAHGRVPRGAVLPHGSIFEVYQGANFGLERACYYALFLTVTFHSGNLVNPVGLHSITWSLVLGTRKILGNGEGIQHEGAPAQPLQFHALSFTGVPYHLKFFSTWANQLAQHTIYIYYIYIYTLQSSPLPPLSKKQN